MSDKQYLRISKDWGVVLYPREEDTYIANLTGSTILAQLSTEKMENPAATETYALAIGGTLPQLKVTKDQYLYARSLADEDESATVIADGKRVDMADIEDVKVDISSLAVEIMKLTNRVSRNEVELAQRDISYTLLRRELLHDGLIRDGRTAALSSNVLSLAMRLFAAETLIYKFRNEYPNTIFRLEALEHQLSEENEDNPLTALEIQISALSNQINNLTFRVNELVPKVEEGWQDYDKLVKEQIEPLKDSVDVLSDDFDSLNNSLVQLAAKYTDEEINTVFDRIIRDVSEDMIGPITALKNLIIDIRHSMKYEDNFLFQGESLLDVLAIGQVSTPAPSPEPSEPDKGEETEEPDTGTEEDDPDDRRRRDFLLLSR